MIIFPSVLQMSKRLVYLLPFSGAVALTAYLLSLSHSVFPGYSASLAAAAVGASHPSAAAHPIFSLVARQVAALDVLSLPVVLNLLSAVCGAMCAMLIGWLVARAILFSASEDPGGGGQAEMDPDEESHAAAECEMPPEVAAFNTLVFRLAVCGGVAASLLFTFSVPAWSAATRLDNGLFSLALGLASFCLFPAVNERWRDAWLALSVFFFAAGFFESGAFVLVLPCYGYFLFRTVFLESDKKMVSGLALVAAGLAGAGCAIYAFRNNVSEAPIAFPALLHTYARELWRHHLFEIRSFFPQQGWLLLLLQVGLPAVILVVGLPTLFKERTTGTAVALVLAALSVAAALLNLPVSPCQVVQPSGHLPVVGSAVIAAAAAMVLSAGLLLVLQESHADTDDLSEQPDIEEGSRFLRLRSFVAGVLVAHVLVCAASFWRSGCAVDNGQAAFADRIARVMLDEMKGRTCLITNGLLDNHLLVQARMLGKPLTLITLRARPSTRETEALRHLIAESALFEGLNRLRLQNALSISTVRFVMEWFGSDSRAAEKAMLFAMPDIWTACGYRPLPEGIAFGGLRGDARPDLPALAERNRLFAERVAPELAKRPQGDRMISGLRMMLQMKTGFAANELGAILEDYGEWEAAYASYLRAVALDPQNVSAAVNCYELARARQLHPEAEDALRKRMKQAVARARVRSMREITWVLQNYGSIRQQAFFQQQTAMWSSLGSRTVAADKARKAQSLAVLTGVASLLGNATTYLQAGELQKAEACFVAAQEKDPASKDALIGLCNLMLGEKRVQEAGEWYRKAQDAGVESLALRYQTVMLALLNGEKERAFKLLQEATKDASSDSRYWVLLADLLLERGDFQFVERQLLPDMQQALKTADHHMVHAVRGMTLQCKGPAFYKESRISLLNALSQNASLSDIWSALLKLDLAIGNAEFTEADVRRLLDVDPDHAFGNYLMGSALLSRGALPESEDYLRRSVERKPTAAACNDLAESLRLQKQLPEAETFVRKALALQPGLAPALDTLACTLFDGGRYQEAAEAAEQALAANPGCTSFQLSALRTQVRLGNKAAVARLVCALSERETAIPDALQNEINALQ